MTYRIISIIEDDYGCEGIPDDEELMCSVMLRGDDGSEIRIRRPDSFLTANKLNVGDTMEVDDEGDL